MSEFIMEQSVIDNLPNILKNSTDTLENISYDNINDEYITNSQKIAIDFDKVKNLYNNENNNSFELKSNDALYIVKNNIYYFIEFKNGDLKDYKNKLSYTIKKDLQLKIYDSWFILSDIEYLDGKKYIPNMFSFSKNCIVYILVYNSKKNGQLKNKSHWINKGKINLLKLFGLAKFEKFLLKEVNIYDENEFETKFINGTIANEP